MKIIEVIECSRLQRHVISSLVEDWMMTRLSDRGRNGAFALRRSADRVG
jgi:hypothetical protein